MPLLKQSTATHAKTSIGTTLNSSSMEVDPQGGCAAPDGGTRKKQGVAKVAAMAVDGEARPVKLRPQKLHKRGQRTGKQQKRKMKNRERALAVAERKSTKLSKGGKREQRKKAAKVLY